MRITAVLLAVLLAASLPACANLVTNGSFEEDSTISVGSFKQLAAGYTGITGWTIGGAGVDWIGSYWTSADGNRSLDMSATSAGIVTQQVINTVVGQQYELTFALSGNPASAKGSKRLDVTVGNVLSQTFYYDTLAMGNTFSDMKWQYITTLFTANSAQTELKFSSGVYNAYGPALDDVSVEAIPEPMSVMLGALGLGSIVGLRRRFGR